MSCLQCFSSKYILEQHKTICLEINGLQLLECQNLEVRYCLKITIDKCKYHL